MYVRELLALVLLKVKGDGFLPIGRLYDQLETQIQALQSMGVASDKYTFLLTPLVESALPDTIARDWDKEKNFIYQKAETEQLEVKFQQLSVEGEKPRVDTLQRLLAFLRREVESEERLNLARSAFSDNTGNLNPVKEVQSSQKARSFPQSKERVKPKIHTAAGLVNIKPPANQNCVFCGLKHASTDCLKARNKSRDELLQILKEKGCCFRCFRGGHSSSSCRTYVRCIICDKNHVPLMCLERKIQTKMADTKSSSDASKLEQNLHSSCHNSVLMQTLRVRIKGVPSLTARVLFDNGSQRSYITKRLVEKMNIVPTGEIKVEHALFGGVVSKPKSHRCYKIRLEDLGQDYSCNFDVLDADTICVVVPSLPIGDLLDELEQQRITLSDTQGGPIDILIGADVGGKLMTGLKIELENGLVAFQTKLGWTLMGKIPSAEPRFMSHINLFTADFSVQDLWRLEAIGIEDSAQVRSREQKAEAAKVQFLESVKILESGRYEVKLPWSEGHAPLPRNFDLALKRFEATSRKLKATSSEDRYFGVFQDWLNAGIIEEIPSDDWDDGHYLPHRPVFKEGSTTPIRPVFDASAKLRGQPSLNQCLEVGPNLVELIPSVLLRFRLGQIGLIADVKRAFLQINVAPEDRDFLRFVWRGKDGILRIFRHTRVVFGVCSSPFLLGAVLEHHLSRCRDLLKPPTETPPERTNESTKPDDVIDKLQKCMYVDNFVGSLDDPNEIQSFIEQASSLFSLACFELRGWSFSDKLLVDHTNTPVLGLLWDQKSDALKINVPTLNDINPDFVTKKNLMSANHRIFDPIGFTSPITVTTKKLIQEAWKTGGGWDTPIDENSRRIFNQWTREIELLGEIQIPRWVRGTNMEGAVYSLHTFADASQIAYAAVIFLRVKWGGQVTLHLLAAKTRIAPVERITIPRLELLAATVGARLASNVLKILPDVHKAYYWSDSSTALAWIKRDQPWAVFVRNRVHEIRKLSEPECWNHISGSLNPADLASRGCSPRSLVDSKWWEGPTWLLSPENEWPKSSVEFDEDEVISERLKGTLMVQSDYLFSAEALTDRIGNYWKMVRVVGWIVRFGHNAREGANRTRGPLTPEEIWRAEKWVVRLAQQEAFTGEGMIEIRKLKPQRTTHDGLLRVRTKIWARDDSEDFRAPIILPSEHIIVERLVYHAHCQNGHIVGQHLLNLLRERFWLVKGRRTVRRIVGQCKRCKRFTAKNLEAESPPLPEERVRDAYVFEVTGTDYAGPLYLANGSKVWVCLFTCAIYRAVHFELVTSLSTESFLLALRRFISRRGRPSVMYSDHGTNFRGAKNLLDHVDWDEIAKHGSQNQIKWRFNPPSAPWWGGFWERMVRSLKNLLRRNIGRASLSFEELNTVICDCESLINSRPITYVSENPEDPVPICPQMFLQEIKQIGTPDCDQIDSRTLNRRIKHRQVVQEELRQRFRAEYLGQLTLTSKFATTREPRVGEMVLIGSEGQKRLDWPLGIIEEIIRGKDGCVRVVYLRTAEGRLCRPIQRIFPLEVSNSNEESTPETDNPMLEDVDVADQLDTIEVSANQETSQSPLRKNRKATKAVCNATTRCGRQVKIPVRFK